MIGLVFSLDYEIYGTGKGDFARLMIDPTARMLDLFDKYDAKLTIMAEVAEIMALKKHQAYLPIAEKIEAQLVDAIKRGHDVQLHFHPGWFNVKLENDRWVLDFNEYALVGLDAEKINMRIAQGKEYLENLLQKIEAKYQYQCIAFRAGNWLMQPCRDIVGALENNGIAIDTSVFKWGHGQVGKYELDYRDAHSDMFSWTVDPEDINKEYRHRQGLKEIPILTKNVFITSMITPKRLKLQRQLRRDSVDEQSESTEDIGGGKKVGGFSFRHAKKFDFCRLTFREMKKFLSYAERANKNSDKMMPVVAIGHSTEFVEDGSLEKFLSYVQRIGTDRVVWTTFNEIHTDQILV